MKHKVALDLHSNNPHEIMLQIQADNEVEDIEAEWAAIVHRVREVFTNRPNTGAWMPNVLGLGWTRRKAQLESVTSDGLVPAMLLDPSCWAIHPDLLEMTRDADYAGNKFGWGTGWLVNLRALANGYGIYWDANIRIVQPKTAGYSHDEARDQAVAFLQVLTSRERFIKRQIQKIMRLRKKRTTTLQLRLKLRLRVKFLRLYLNLR
jgi:hypothetical protein